MGSLKVYLRINVYWTKPIKEVCTRSQSWVGFRVTRKRPETSGVKDFDRREIIGKTTQDLKNGGEGRT